MANFQEILSKPAASIERPKAYPVGTYLCLVDGQPEFTKIGQKQTDATIFQLKILQAGPDVDAQGIADAGGVTGKRLRHTLFITEDSVWRLKQFLVDHLGIDQGTKNLSQLIAEAPGRQVSVSVKHRVAQDGSTIYAEVGATAHV